MSKKRALSGIKSTGEPHLGNLLGMILPSIALQDDYECLYFIADYHALTSQHNAEVMRQDSLKLAATFLALGLDPQKAILFRQSDLPEVTELSWILSCFTPLGYMQKAHAYKDSIEKKKEVSHGLFSYPVLMAADILLYDSNIVPVGKDQQQHIEITRDIAVKVNNAWGEDSLVLPEAKIKESVQTITGLDGQKMSKSYGNTVEIFLEPKKLRKKLMRIVTDSLGVEDKKDPETCNVFKIYQLVATKEQQNALAKRYTDGGMGYGEAKQELFEVLNELLEAPRAKYNELLEQEELLEAVLKDGAERARAIASVTLERIRTRAGLGPRKINLQKK